MGTRRSKHNKGRKAVYKDHRSVARHLIEHPIYGGGHYNARTWWTDTDAFKLSILAEANSDVEASADAIGRPAKSLVWKAQELGFVIPPQWRNLIRVKRKAPLPPMMSYPYIAKARDEHADILAINDVIPKSIPEHMRADMCQEIMLAVLEERITIDALRAKKANASYFIKKFYHNNYEDGGHAISFNATDEDWDSDAIASSIAAKEWRENEMRDHRAAGDIARRTFTAPTQFEAAWQSQIGRVHIEMQQLGHYLSREEVEEILEAESA